MEQSWYTKESIIRDLMQLTQGTIPLELDVIADNKPKMVYVDEDIDVDSESDCSDDLPIKFDPPDLAEIPKFLNMVADQDEQDEESTKHEEILEKAHPAAMFKRKVLPAPSSKPATSSSKSTTSSSKCTAPCSPPQAKEDNTDSELAKQLYEQFNNSAESSKVTAQPTTWLNLYDVLKERDRKIQLKAKKKNSGS